MPGTTQHRVAKHWVRLLQDLRSDVLRGTPSRGLNLNLLRRRREIRRKYCSDQCRALSGDKSLAYPKLTQSLLLPQLKRYCRGFTATDAQACHTATAACTAQCTKKRNDQARTRGADRVAHRTGTTMGVDLIRVQTEVTNCSERHHCKCLVDLK